MPSGQMSSNGNYPSSTGIPSAGTAIGQSFRYPRHIAALSICKTPGSGASYKLQAEQGDGLDSSETRWVDIPNSTLTAVGHLCVTFVGKSVRLVADNGTSPGTGNNTPTYTLDVFPHPNNDSVCLT